MYDILLYRKPKKFKIGIANLWTFSRSFAAIKENANKIGNIVILYYDTEWMIRNGKWGEKWERKKITLAWGRRMEEVEKTNNNLWERERMVVMLATIQFPHLWNRNFNLSITPPTISLSLSAS